MLLVAAVVATVRVASDLVVWPRVLAAIRDDHESFMGALRLNGIARLVLAIAEGAVLAIGMFVIARAAPIVRRSAILAGILVLVAIPISILGSVLPEIVGDLFIRGSATDWLYSGQRISFLLLRAGAIVAIVVALRRLADEAGRPGIKAMATALAALVVIRLPMPMWGWLVASVPERWGVWVSLCAQTVLFVVVAALLRRTTREAAA